MKILINPNAQELSSDHLPAGLNFVQQPKLSIGLGISILVGLGLPIIPILLLSFEAWLFPHVNTNQSETIPMWIIFPVLLVSILVHEFLHLLWHPGWGLSSRSLVLVWPLKLQFGVYYEGFMSRTRWLVMRLSPLVGLTLLPTLVLLIVYCFEMSFFWQQFIVLVILVNSLGAGSDLVASVIVARQVPLGGEVGNWNGRACWRER
jgi:hypothetical protein